MTENIIIDFMSKSKSISQIKTESGISEGKTDAILYQRLPKINNSEYVHENLPSEYEEIIEISNIKNSKGGEIFNVDLYKADYDKDKSISEDLKEDILPELTKKEEEEIEMKIENYLDNNKNTDANKVKSTVERNILSASFVFSELKNIEKEEFNNLSTNQSTDSISIMLSSTDSSQKNYRILHEEFVESNLNPEIHQNYINSLKKYRAAKTYCTKNKIDDQRIKLYFNKVSKEFSINNKLYYDNIKISNIKAFRVFAIYFLKCLRDEEIVVSFLNRFFIENFNELYLQICKSKNLLPKELMEILLFLSGEKKECRIQNTEYLELMKLLSKISCNYVKYIHSISKMISHYDKVDNFIDNPRIELIESYININLINSDISCTESVLIHKLLFSNTNEEIYKKDYENINEEISILDYLKELILRAEKSSNRSLISENITLSLVIKSFRECCGKCKANLFYLKREISKALQEIGFKGDFKILFLYEKSDKAKSISIPSNQNNPINSKMKDIFTSIKDNLKDNDKKIILDKLIQKCYSIDSNTKFDIKSIKVNNPDLVLRNKIVFRAEVKNTFISGGKIFDKFVKDNLENKVKDDEKSVK